MNQGFQNRRTFQDKYLNDENTFLVAGGNQQRPESQLTMVKEEEYRMALGKIRPLTSNCFDKHDLTVLAGYTAQKYSGITFRASAGMCPTDPDLWYLIAGDPNTSTNTA